MLLAMYRSIISLTSTCWIQTPGIVASDAVVGSGDTVHSMLQSLRLSTHVDVVVVEVEHLVAVLVGSRSC